MNYYDWRDSKVRCSECGWSGHGSETESGEFFSEGAEYHCPQCSHRLMFVPFPTLQENLTDSRSDPADRKAAAIILRRRRRFDRSKLVAAGQLPDLDPSPKTLAWDVVNDPGSEAYVTVLNGEQEIWREISWYENFRRFGEIARILRQKYGNSLRDLIPTPRSELDLYGDRLSSITYVERVRGAIARGEDPP